METVAVIDFETTGLNPQWGDRATEIAVALVRDGQIVDRYQSLMNAGRRIPPDVIRLTGITNEMIARAPDAAKVMSDVARFVGKLPMVAHNAGFDRRFWDAELERISVRRDQSFACTLLLSRRIYPASPDHKLGTLGSLLGLPVTGQAHRAMADAEMASNLWCRIQADVTKTYGVRDIGHEMLTRVQGTPRAQVPKAIENWGQSRISREPARS